MNNSINTEKAKANNLADRILQGANALITFAENLTPAEWNTPVDGDGRSIGVVVHHVASSYPMEIELAQMLAASKPIEGATMAVVDKINADHAAKFSDVGKQESIDLLRKNSEQAAETVRSFTDEELENSATVSLNANAPLTAQFFIEDHALRHSFHHLEKIKATLQN